MMQQWFLSSAVLAAAVIALRYFLRGRVSARLQYALWALVLLRLLLPVSLGESKLSVINAVPERAESAVQDTLLSPPSEVSSLPVADEPQDTVQLDTPTQTAPAASNEKELDWERLAGSVYLAGVTLTAATFLATNLRFARRLRRSRRLIGTEDGLCVYESAAMGAPCLFGLLRPSVYVTPETTADAQTLRHALAHECTHRRHGDHIWSLLRCVCLALHWFDPLVWWAAELSRRDAELACDEAVVRRLGEDERAAYGRTLLQLSVQRRPPFVMSSTMSEGGDLKERVALLVRRPKTAAATLAVVLALGVLLAACTFTGGQNPADAPSDDPARVELPDGTDSGVYDTVDALIAAIAPKEVTYYLTTDDGTPQEVTERVVDSRYAAAWWLGSLECEEGTLELRYYDEYLKPEDKAGALPERFVWVGGYDITDDGYIFSGQQTLLVLLHREDGYQLIKRSESNEGLLWLDGINYDSADRYLYDFYLKWIGSDLPRRCITNENGTVCTRYDGEGWYLYVPDGTWHRTTDGQDCWYSAYLTGSALRVVRREESADALRQAYLAAAYAENGDVLCRTDEDAQTEILLCAAPDGGCYEVIIRWSLLEETWDNGLASSDVRAQIELEIPILRAMMRSFTVQES